MLIPLGSTERKILSSLEEIVEKSLPADKMTAYYDDPEAAKLCILSKITFCETRQKVSFLNYSIMTLRQIWCY